jgi:butyryl-CoA dehydrogenase
MDSRLRGNDEGKRQTGTDGQKLISADQEVEPERSLSMSAIVNRRDVDFVLYEMFDLEALFATPRYAAWDRAAITAVLDTAQTIAETRYLPCAAAIDASEPHFVDGKVAMDPAVGEALRAFAEAGLFAAGFDEAVGGMQLPMLASLMVNGMFQAANVALANYSFLTIANAHLIDAFGTAEQKARFLGPLLEGRWFGTMCLSEPQAGSSLSDIRTRAEPLGDGRYRITGSKMWISGGDHELTENIVHLVLAKIPGGPPGVKGISLFIVPRYRVDEQGAIGAWNNIALAGLNHKMGQRGTVNCLLNFGEAGDCIGHLVGEPHQGLAYMFHMMNEARVGVGHGAASLGLAGYLQSLDYAINRPQGRLPHDKDPASPQVPIIEHADVKRMLMAQKVAVEGSIALLGFCSLLLDRQKAVEDGAERARIGLLLDILTPVAKSWPSEHCLEANKHAIQILGGYGYTRDYPVERIYRDNRLNHIHEGTFAIHGIDLLGRKVRMQGGAALAALVREIDATIDAGLADAELAPEAAALRTALTALETATRAVIGCHDQNRALANATLYLDAFGDVMVGWMWLWQARVARTGLETAPDDAFYRGKMAAFRYFFRYELPKVHATIALVGALDDTCLAMSVEAF